jgi:hypothetical protein
MFRNNEQSWPGLAIYISNNCGPLRAYPLSHFGLMQGNRESRKNGRAPLSRPHPKK